MNAPILVITAIALLALAFVGGAALVAVMLWRDERRLPVRYDLRERPEP